VYKVSPHGKLPVPNNEDYNLEANTYDVEFFQEDDLEGRFEIDLTEATENGSRYWNGWWGGGGWGANVNDLEMLEGLHLGNDNDKLAPSDGVDYEIVDSDDETYALTNPDHKDYF
jgi:hypothetical protein